MSGEILCNDKLRFAYPEGFYEMTEEELSSLNVLEEGPGSVITDPQRHIIASFGWKPMGGISFLIVNTKDVFNGMRKQILEPMTAYGVRDGGAITRQLDGEAAEGFCYEYTAGETPMYAESYVIKHKKVLYYLHFYARAALKEESLACWNEILASAKWL